MTVSASTNPIEGRPTGSFLGAKIPRRRDWARVGRFVSVYAWLVRDGLVGKKRRVVTILACSFLGAVAEGSTIALLVLFIRIIESGEVPLLGSIGSGQTTPVLVLTIAAISLLALQIFSALATYFSAVWGRAVAREYNAAATARVLHYFGGRPFLRPLDSDRSLARGEIIQLMQRNPRIMATALESIVDMIHPLAYTGAYTVALLALDWRPTVVIAPLFLLAIPVFYSFGTHVQGTAKEFYSRATRGLASSIQKYTSLINDSNLHPAWQRDEVVRRYHDDQAVRDFFESFDHMRLSGNRMVLITSLFRPLLLVAVLAVIGYFAVQGTMTWGYIIVYIGALWQVVGRSQAVTGRLTNLTRFHPQVAEFRAFCAAVAAMPEPARGSAADAPARIALASAGRIPGGVERVDLAGGDVAALVTERRLDRVELFRILKPLMAGASEGAASLESARFLTSRTSFTSLSLAANLLGTSAPGPDGIVLARAPMERLGLGAEVEALPQGLETEMSDGRWDELPWRLRLGLRLAALHLAGRGAVFVDADLLASARAAFGDDLGGLFADHVLFVVARPAVVELPEGATVIAVDDDVIAGIGDGAWWRETDRCRDARAAAAAGGAADQLDDELSMEL